MIMKVMLRIIECESSTTLKTVFEFVGDHDRNCVKLSAILELYESVFLMIVYVLIKTVNVG